MTRHYAARNLDLNEDLPYSLLFILKQIDLQLSTLSNKRSDA